MRSPESPIRRSRRHEPVEVLEARIAPAAVTAPATFTYTDADGDAVSVQIVGKGSVEFLNADGEDVSVTGGDLASVVITKPNAAFGLLFSDTNAGGDNVVQLGRIAGPDGARLPSIFGIFTADSSADVRYELAGFLGTNFAAKGGLKILGGLTGDASSATLDLDLLKLGAAAGITFRDGIAAEARALISGDVAGSVKIGEINGELTLGSVKGLVQLGHIDDAGDGSVTLQQGLSGRLFLGEAPLLDEPNAVEVITIAGGISPKGVVTSQQNAVLSVGKSAAGLVNVSGDLTLTVGQKLNGASISAGSDLRINVAGAVVNAAVVAGQEILPGSTIGSNVTSSEFLGGNGATLEVTGSTTGSRFSGGVASLNLTVSGSVVRSQLLGGGDNDVTVGFSVDRSSILADGQLNLEIGQQPQGGIAGVGNLSRSTVGSKSTSAVVSVGGRVSGSQLTAGTTLNVTAGGVVDANVLQSGNDLFLTADLDVLRSRIVAGSDASLLVGGQVASSALLISNNLDATIGRTGLPVVLKKKPLAGLIDSRLETSDGNINISVVGPVERTLLESGQDVAVNVSDLVGLDEKTNQPEIVQAGAVKDRTLMIAAGSVNLTSQSSGNAGARIFAGGGVSVDVPGRFNGSVTAAEDLTLSAGSLVVAKDYSVPVTGAYATSVFPLAPVASVDPTLPTFERPTVPGSGKPVQIVARGGLRVGGDLSLVVSGKATAPLVEVGGDVVEYSVGGNLATKMVVRGNFVAGTPTAAAAVVGGNVSKSSLIQIAGNVGSADSASTYNFAKAFAGTLEIGGDLRVDLNFGGDVQRLVLDGRFAPLSGNAVADIVVQGRLKELSATGVFTRTSANGGTFASDGVEGAGAVEATGGAILVGPFVSASPTT